MRRSPWVLGTFVALATCCAVGRAAPFTNLLDGLVDITRARRQAIADPVPDDQKKAAKALDKALLLAGKDASSDEDDAKIGAKMSNLLLHKFPGDTDFGTQIVLLDEAFDERLEAAVQQADPEVAALPEGKPKKKAAKRLKKAKKLQVKALAAKWIPRALKLDRKALKKLAEVREILAAAAPGGGGGGGGPGPEAGDHDVFSVYLTDVDFDDTLELLAAARSGRTVELSEAIGTPHVAKFAVSPNGDRVAYAQTGGAAPGLYLVDVDGANRVLVGPDRTEITNIVWSPLSDFVGYLSDVSGELQLFVAPADGSANRNVSGTVGSVLETARWAADGSRVGYASDKVEPGQHMLHTVRGDGTGGVRVSPSQADPGRTRKVDFSFAPSGARVAYRTDVDEATGVSDLFTSNADGSQVNEVSNETTSQFSVGSGPPVWSSDGAALLYRRSHAASGDLHLFMGSGDGSPAVDVSDGIAGDVKLWAWNPAGGTFAFVVENTDLYVGDGSAAPQKIGTFGYVRELIWHPQGQEIAVVAGTSQFSTPAVHTVPPGGEAEPVERGDRAGGSARFVGWATTPGGPAKEGDVRLTGNTGWLGFEHDGMAVDDFISFKELNEQAMGGIRGFFEGFVAALTLKSDHIGGDVARCVAVKASGETSQAIGFHPDNTVVPEDWADPVVDERRRRAGLDPKPIPEGGASLAPVDVEHRGVGEASGTNFEHRMKATYLGPTMWMIALDTGEVWTGSVDGDIALLSSTLSNSPIEALVPVLFRRELGLLAATLRSSNHTFELRILAATGVFGPEPFFTLF